MPWRDMAAAVAALDPAAMRSADEVRVVQACVPTPEERAMFEAFLASGGAPERLSDAERFCLMLMAVRASIHALHSAACLV